ncbi:MAG TPA: hypothetical protein VLT84_04515 [Acidobacteriota bacterium]|nr:hypothetical protein [Acidobacteriota bacterium]
MNEPKASAAKRRAWAALTAVERGTYFGPLFFLQHLQGLVRDRCPDPAEGLPAVHLRLADGEDLDVCHVIGVTPKWLALAVHETDRPGVMRTELVPYAMITRLTLGAVPSSGGTRMGFNAAREPEVIGGPALATSLTPEAAIEAVAGRRTRRPK